ncbi:unnamed protein product [Sphagnum tenellum]
MRNIEVIMRKFIDIVSGQSQEILTEGFSFLRELATIAEVAPSGKKAAHFITHAKKDFKKRYGKNWKKVLYATAWKNFGESVQEAAPYKIPHIYGWWITHTGDMLDVEKFQHEQIAREWIVANDHDYRSFTLPNGDQSDETTYMINAFGWIRVVNGKGVFGFMGRQKGLARKAVETAGYMIDDLTGDREIVVELIGHGTETGARPDMFDSHDAKKAINMLRQNIGHPVQLPLK